MFYRVKDRIEEISLEQIEPGILTIGLVSSEELPKVGNALRIDADTIEASSVPNPMFRTDVEVRETYTFAEIRVVNKEGEDDFISMYIMDNLLLIVDILDRDGSTMNSFTRALKRYPGNKMCAEKLLCYFFEALLSEGNKVTEIMRNELTEIEEDIVSGTAEREMNIELLNIEKRILKYFNYYSQILDITETLEENDNDIFDEDKLIYISNLTNKVSRLRDDMNSLSNITDHLQDAYASLLDQRMNSTMKVFTIITTIFFPLTIIVGWYGMNFQNMPELAWKYGYLYVTVLSVVVVLLLIIIGKKKKWF